MKWETFLLKLLFCLQYIASSIFAKGEEWKGKSSKSNNNHRSDYGGTHYKTNVTSLSPTTVYQPWSTPDGHNNFTSGNIVQDHRSVINNTHYG